VGSTVLEVHLNLGGFPVILFDTAGLRPGQIGNSDQDKIESEGMRRAINKAREADIKLLLFDTNEEIPHGETMALIDENSIILRNKIDLSSNTAQMFHVKQDVPSYDISILNGANIDMLIEGLTKSVTKKFNVSRETPSLTRHRHRQHLLEAQEYIEKSLAQLQPELMAQDLRFALHSIGRITGRVDVEDLLDVIFKDFCIGK